MIDEGELEMNITKDKKGFTLIELLAVIVILAIIILMAATNIGGLTTTAKKNVLAVEGNTMVDSAKLAYQQAQLNSELEGGIGNVCFELQYLYENGFFDKSNSDSYNGSVEVIPGNNGKTFSYKFWISNGSLKLDAAESEAGKVGSGVDVGASGKSVVVDNSQASDDCNGFSTPGKGQLFQK